MLQYHGKSLLIALLNRPATRGMPHRSSSNGKAYRACLAGVEQGGSGRSGAGRVWQEWSRAGLAGVEQGGSGRSGTWYL